MGFGSVGSQLNRVNRRLQLSIRRSFKARRPAPTYTDKSRKFEYNKVNNTPRRRKPVGKVNTLALILVALIISIVMYLVLRP